MSDVADDNDGKTLLIEIGTEDLPAGPLASLAEGFANAVRDGLAAERLCATECHWYATPRRLATQLAGLPARQTDQQRQRLGPTLDKAFVNGKPTRAALGFARAAGVAVEQLQSEQGRLVCQVHVPGQNIASLLPAIMQRALERLPGARYMRWSSSPDQRFVRPVRWLVVLLDEAVVDCEIMGCRAGRLSRGHRFHYPQPLSLRHASDYVDALRAARVQADYGERRERIRQSIQALAKQLGGEALVAPGLLDEVTALNEWPVALRGQFDPDFLSLPREILIATLQEQQRYFPVQKDHALLPAFLFISNVDAAEPGRIVRGNERVVQPRLADARFFYQRDCARPLAARLESLREVLWQKDMGTLHDRTERLQAIITTLAEALGEDTDASRRSAQLAKCDLVTETVGEFPGLQGIVGGHLARHDGESDPVASAIAGHYLPRFAGDQLPGDIGAQLLAVADRLDHLLGNCLGGHMPTGDKDPYSLRRAALGLARIVVECGLDIDLRAQWQAAMRLFPATLQKEKPVETLLVFLRERLRTWWLESGHPADSLEAVLALGVDRPLDCHQRLLALARFRRQPEARALVLANKRIRNILKQAEPDRDKHDPSLLRESAERTLGENLLSCREQVAEAVARADYGRALACLGELPIDAFFDQVLVLCDEPPLRDNRLALLSELRTLFLGVADLSRLSEPG